MAGAGRRMMHAVQYNKYGGGPAGLKHVEVPVPTPGKDEVLLKVEAVSINPVDWKIQKGVMRPFVPPKFPYIPGSDVAGEVVEVGGEVTNFKPGDEVVTFIGLSMGGGMGEFAIAKGSFLVPRPPEVSAAEAAALPVAAVTAYRALTHVLGLKLDVQTGHPRNILVTAASGGVGHFAVQLAKLGNAHVTATCGARNMELVRSLGADEVLDYKTPDGASLRSPSGKKYDGVIHCTSGIGWSRFERELSDNGKVVDLTPGPSTMTRFALQKLTFSKKKVIPLIIVYSEERIGDLGYLVGLVKEGKLKSVIDSKHPLSRAEEGWGKSIDGHATGKIVVEP